MHSLQSQCALFFTGNGQYKAILLYFCMKNIAAMIQKSWIEDASLGVIDVKRDARAKHLILRTNGGKAAVTAPPGTPDREIRAFIGQYRDKLEELIRQHRPRILLPDYEIRTDLFWLSFEEGTEKRFLARSQPGRLSIIYPPGTDFHDENLQQWLRKAIEKALAKNARLLLPPRLKALAGRHGLDYAQVRITTSKGRWGSCSARKHINLSCYLLLLPAHLIDYVMLHELAHTKEMNHGTGFWRLLNSLAGGKALCLRRELRTYRTELP